MNSYIDKNTAVEALKRMKKFHSDLQETMKDHGLSLTANLGRRNVLLSQAQEKFFADELAKKFDVSSSGRTGEPDIIINSLGRELECKLTSPSSTGALCFQTDYDTILRKGSVDYLYVVADASFDSFAVLHYTDLTVNDFGPVANGSRGRVQLLKHKAADRLVPLVGGFRPLKHSAVEKLNAKFEKTKSTKSKDRILKSIEYWTKQPERYAIQMEKI